MAYVTGWETPTTVAAQDNTLINETRASGTFYSGPPEVSTPFLVPTSGRILLIVGGEMRGAGAEENQMQLVPELYEGPSRLRGSQVTLTNLEWVKTPSIMNASVAGSAAHVITGLQPVEHFVRVMHEVEGSATDPRLIRCREVIVVPLP